MVGEIGPGWSLAVGKYTLHIIQILSISKMHLASAIDASMMAYYLEAPILLIPGATISWKDFHS